MTFPGLDVTSHEAPLFPLGDRTQLNSVVSEAKPNGGTQTYTFVASRPGTFYYQSGSNQPIQLRMGLFGAIIVRPSQNGTSQSINDTDYRFLRGLYTLATGTTGTGITKTFTQFAYNDGDGSTGYDREFLILTSEMDPAFHSWMEFGGTYDISKWKANYWFINGRCGPDTMDMPNVKNLPYQPYNAMPLMHPGEVVLVRYVGMGRDLHPFHTHGNHVRVVATDGRLLSTSTNPALLALIFPGKPSPSPSSRARPLTAPLPGQAGNSLGPLWTQSNRPAGTLRVSCRSRQGVHAKPASHRRRSPGPCARPGGSGSHAVKRDHDRWLLLERKPLSGTEAPLPPGEGGFNPYNAFFFMWHSHAEREITNNDIFPGGMLTMMGVVPWSAPIEE